MAKRGKKRISLQILRLSGAFRADRHGERSEISLPNEPPKAPDFLSPVALAKWDELAGMLAAAGILTRADWDVLTTYCQTWGDLREIEEFCRDPKTGKALPIVKTQAGNLIQNPAFGVRSTLRKQLRDLAASLGITPVDRSNVKAVPQTEKPIDVLLEQTRGLWDKKKSKGKRA